jgi:hypothetical protein
MLSVGSYSLKTAGRFLTEEARKAIAALQSCVVPLFNADQDHKAQLLGSAVLIEVSGEIFLCTAKHVLDACKKDRSFLYICGPTALEPLAGSFRVSGNDLDTAVLKLTDKKAKRFRDAQPLQAESIGNQVQAERCQYVEFIGFPATKNKRSIRRFVLKNRIQCNGCTVKAITPLEVRVKFNKQRNRNATTRKRVTAPDPHGMSGGGMFGIMMNDDTIAGKPTPLLIGISTTIPNPTEVYGTNIRAAMAIIRDDYDISLPWRLDPKGFKVPTQVMSFDAPEDSMA